MRRGQEDAEFPGMGTSDGVESMYHTQEEKVWGEE